MVHARRLKRSNLCHTRESVQEMVVFGILSLSSKTAEERCSIERNRQKDRPVHCEYTSTSKYTSSSKSESPLESDRTLSSTLLRHLLNSLRVLLSFLPLTFLSPLVIHCSQENNNSRIDREERRS